MATKKKCEGTVGTGKTARRCKKNAISGVKFCSQHSPLGETPEAEKQPDDAENQPIVTGDLVTASELAPAIAADPLFVKYEIAKRVAQALSSSQLVPEAYRGRPNDVFVAINMGSELGMDPFQAIQSIAVIEGKPCLYGDGLIGVVRASSKCAWIKESLSDDEKTATCETQRAGDPHTITATYSMDDAAQAGIHTKFNWKKHPKRMLQMRARAYCLRDAYPDLLKGLGVVEERQDHEDTPPPIAAYALPEATANNVPDPIQPETVITLAEVEKAMRDAPDMAALLKTTDLVKGLISPHDVATARVTYRMNREVLQSAEGQNK